MKETPPVFIYSPSAEWDEDTQKKAIDNFHELYYYKQGWDRNLYLGYQIKQCPFDLQTYQQLITELRPNFIFQTGIAGGGSLLYFATLLDLINAPQENVVIGVDIELSEEARTLKHPRIHTIEGDSVNPDVVAHVRSLVSNLGRRALISLDSLHTAPHVKKELDLYHSFIDAGSYITVEDCNVNGHPVRKRHGVGPYEATDTFLQEQPGFIEDNEIWSNHLLSFHRWLKRIY